MAGTPGSRGLATFEQLIRECLIPKVQTGGNEIDVFIDLPH